MILNGRICSLDSHHPKEPRQSQAAGPQLHFVDVMDGPAWKDAAAAISRVQGRKLSSAPAVLVSQMDLRFLGLSS